MNVNDRVKYTSGHWDDSNTNPLWNGKYGCILGTIIGVRTADKMAIGMLEYEVRWDNGSWNTYYENDLEDIKLDTMFDEIIDNL